MENLLPAIIIGGPPHSGKSVLFYNLTKELHERGVIHHAIRACPDGEGNWYQEIQHQLDPESIRLIRVKNEWTPAFVNGICHDLEHRHLPLLVDMGGKPSDLQKRMLHYCTHSLLLLNSEKRQASQEWRDFVNDFGLVPFAEIISRIDGPSTILTTTPVISGTMTGLERGSVIQNPLFEALVEGISTLFCSYSLEELEQIKLTMAPTPFTVNLGPLRRKIDPLALEWAPSMLPQLEMELPQNTPIAVYGRGPNWLYGMLAALAPEFFQFDPRIGWLHPPHINIGLETAWEDMSIRTLETPGMLRLSIRLASEHLDYLQLEHVSFPPVPADLGMVLDGKLPLWLVTALVRLYQQAGVPWIACYQPKLKGAVVVFSRVSSHTIGDLVPLEVFPQGK